ncbi:MAG: cadmium-translocating P-type ATPase [Planctomycetes bacterium]|nr:cadmium-translocating P-type ATPase [Planctomycetota bacterium]
MDAKHQFSVLHVESMDCPDELRVIESRLKRMPGIIDLEANFIQHTLTVVHERSLPAAEVQEAIRQAGFEAVPRGEENKEMRWWPRHGRGALTIISGALLALGGILYAARAHDAIVGAALLAAMATGGFYVVRKGVRSALKLNFEMNFLMTVAAVGAVAVGESFEGASVMFLFSMAQWLESRAMDRARDAIRKLLDLSPGEAVVVRDGAEVRVPAADVAVGETLIIRPAEKIPLDGVVTEGVSAADESPVTGESMPVEKSPGSGVFAGSLNGYGSLTIRATRIAEDSTLSKIIHMVEEARSRRAPSQQFVDRFARIYTPAVIGGAVLVATVPVLFGGLFNEWFYRALVLLVIACPCALVISTPVTIVCALARAARNGVLIKGGAHLEHVGKLDTIIFDKTGTLTAGRPDVVEVLSLDDAPPREVLRLAAGVESRSEHHLARAVLRKAESEGVEPAPIANFAAMPGRGARAEIDGGTCYVGGLRLFRELGCNTASAEKALQKSEAQGRAVVLVGSEKKILGGIVLSDVIRPNAADALARLRALGIDDFIMLTGDNEATAQAIAQQLDMDHYHAGLLPEDKVKEVRMTLEESKLAAMVGDGVNDAPALAASTVGIAMGTAGTDAALETADIALMADDLGKLPYTVSLARKAVAIIRQNIAAALLIKAAFIALTVVGIAGLWHAVVADMGASLLVIFNGMRMLNFEEKRPK